MSLSRQWHSFPKSVEVSPICDGPNFLLWANNKVNVPCEVEVFRMVLLRIQDWDVTPCHWGSFLKFRGPRRKRGPCSFWRWSYYVLLKCWGECEPSDTPSHPRKCGSFKLTVSVFNFMKIHSVRDRFFYSVFEILTVVLMKSARYDAVSIGK